MSKKLVKRVVDVLIAFLTALATALTASSCDFHLPFNL